MAHYRDFIPAKDNEFDVWFKNLYRRQPAPLDPHNKIPAPAGEGIMWVK
jgi:hypothetical protein